MTKAEALALLAKYAPGATFKGSPANYLLALVESRGHLLGVDHADGAWVIWAADQKNSSGAGRVKSIFKGRWK